MLSTPSRIVMRHKIRVTVGDTVQIEMMPYDLHKGRITYRC